MNLIETLQALSRENVDFVLVGGLAVSLHGVVASIEHLIEMKSSADRDIDRFDVDALRRLEGGRDA
jgi:hypothetical protein